MLITYTIIKHITQAGFLSANTVWFICTILDREIGKNENFIKI